MQESEYDRRLRRSPSFRNIVRRGVAEEAHHAPPLSVLREREQNMLAPRTPNMVLLGDPTPGRSALDKRDGR